MSVDRKPFFIAERRSLLPLGEEAVLRGQGQRGTPRGACLSALPLLQGGRREQGKHMSRVRLALTHASGSFSALNGF